MGENMKFASIYLKNYIGIYNGMGLYEIFIDMTKCKNRITIIRGDNGSGKSTLAKAMNVFPDPNDSFIPGLPARKEVVLCDNETAYKLVFIHDIKQSGERETTKAYITKTIGPEIVELNPNGNVSSYKDILYTELGLDANFIALSQLSNDDRGLADKKPAERKRFVNSIISSLDVYNNIYKTLTKKSSNLKSMISSIVAKLDMIGDTENLKSQLTAIENKLNIAQDNKDLAIRQLAEAQSSVKILDPDNSIQQRDANLKRQFSEYQREIEKINATISSMVSSYKLEGKDFDKEYKDIMDAENQLSIDNQIARNTLDSFIDRKDTEAQELARKIQQLKNLDNNINYEEYKSKCIEYENTLKSIEDEFKRCIGINDILSITKDEYVLALETLKDISESISIFKNNTDYNIQNMIINEYNNSDILQIASDVGNIRNSISEKENILADINKSITEISAKLDLLDILKSRPSECKIDSCSFIKNALDFSNTNPEDRLSKLISYKTQTENELNELNKELSFKEAYNAAVNEFNNILRMIHKNSNILFKIPKINSTILDKKAFINMLMNNDSFDFVQEIYSHIDMCNLFDLYNKTKEVYKSLKDELALYESKIDIINSINEDINRINDSISAIVSKIEPIRNEISSRENKIAELKKLESVYCTIFEQLKQHDEYNKNIIDIQNQINDNAQKMSAISIAINNMITSKNAIESCNKEIKPLLEERDKINHLIQVTVDYNRERAELEQKYEYIETIKYYSSPTTGIQLVFMELYMGKIIALANKLLSLLFGGEFVIQPFIINESEFRIPCLGSGYLNDDISSMSSSQIGMISMILSFSLLYNSSTKYNIIKLDEIDGPLDYNNRVYFADVLNNIMDIMGTEQCIMISHNSELQVDNADIILLKHDTSNPEYNRGNIIWSY